MTNYSVQNQWGGDKAPWHDGGVNILSSRQNQNVLEMNLKTNDGGKTLEGTMTYQNEGPIGVKAVHTVGSCYKVQNQWGGPNAPWNDAAPWIIGCRCNQLVEALNFKAAAGDGTLTGTMQYAGEGPIGFKATPIKY